MSEKDRQATVDDSEYFDARVQTVGQAGVALPEPRHSLKLLRFDEVSRRTTLGRSAIYALISTGDFPKPVKLGPTARAVAWVDTEIDEWIRHRMEGRTS